MIRTVSLIAVTAVLLALPSNASAYWPYLGYGWGYGNAWGLNPTNYVPAPPYFAVHPPVYYSSQITARHYGASPYAWLPGMQPIQYVDQVPFSAIQRPVVAPVGSDPRVVTATPAVIENPYFPAPAAEQAGDASKELVAALKIENPYVASAGR